jgi:CubicO group peptidase (beta-lactamase class C family)
VRRRAFLGCLALSGVAWGQDWGGLASEVTQFMAQYQVPGLSVAFARQGRMVYQHGFGFADTSRREPVNPSNRFRIASVTKPFTSATLMRLMEAGRLRLSDRVFGPGSILGDDFGQPSGPWLTDLSVEHLLTHTGGGWPNDGTDPMFHHREMDQRQLIAWTLANQPLSNPPGTHYAYSNFGYCILGRVVEKLTGKPYEQAVRDLVLVPCGIHSMEIGDNRRRPQEVVYYGGEPYAMNVRRMDSHGGWIATASDLVAFLLRVDDFPSVADILRHDTIQTMVTGTTANPHYAKGWEVNDAHNWWHNGSLPGTTTLMVRTSSGWCWAALTNTRQEGMGLALDRLMWRLRELLP